MPPKIRPPPPPSPGAQRFMTVANADHNPAARRLFEEWSVFVCTHSALVDIHLKRAEIAARSEPLSAGPTPPPMPGKWRGMFTSVASSWSGLTQRMGTQRGKPKPGAPSGDSAEPHPKSAEGAVDTPTPHDDANADPGAARRGKAVTSEPVGDDDYSEDVAAATRLLLGQPISFDLDEELDEWRRTGTSDHHTEPTTTAPAQNQNEGDDEIDLDLGSMDGTGEEKCTVGGGGAGNGNASTTVDTKAAVEEAARLFSDYAEHDLQGREWSGTCTYVRYPVDASPFSPARLRSSQTDLTDVVAANGSNRSSDEEEGQADGDEKTKARSKGTKYHVVVECYPNPVRAPTYGEMLFRVVLAFTAQEP